LNDSPTVRERELPDSPQMSSKKMAFPHNFFGNESLTCSAQGGRLSRVPEGQGRLVKKRLLEAGRSAFLLSQISFLLKARRSAPNKAGANPGRAWLPDFTGQGRTGHAGRKGRALILSGGSRSASAGRGGAWGSPSGGPFQASGLQPMRRSSSSSRLRRMPGMLKPRPVCA